MNATIVSRARQLWRNNGGAEIQPIRQLRQNKLLSVHNFNALGCLQRLDSSNGEVGRRRANEELLDVITAELVIESWPG